MRARWVAVLLVLGVARNADAGWQYRIECTSSATGGCAPDRLAMATLYSGVFADHEECDAARWRDHEAWRPIFESSLNVGGVQPCEQVGVDADDGGGGPVRPNPWKNVAVTRFETAFVVSSGWSVRERGNPMTYDGQGAGALAFDIHGGRPQFSILFGTQLGVSRVDSPFFNGADGIFVWTIHTGFSSTPFSLAKGSRIDLRPVLAVRLGLAVPGGCAELCDKPSVFFPSVGLFGRVSAGLSAFLGADKTIGIGFDVGIPFGQMGNVDDDVAPTDLQFEAPPWEAGLTIQVRNSAVRGW